MLDKSQDSAHPAQPERQPVRDPWIPPHDATDTEQIHALTEAVHDLMNWRQTMERGVFAFQIAASEHLQMLTMHIEAITTQLEALTDTQARAQARAQESSGDFQRTVSNHLELLSQQMHAQGGSLNHLEQLSQHMKALQAQVDSLDNALYVSPYAADPALLHTTDADGRAIIGFSASLRDPTGIYRGFEDIFRGPEDFIRERQRVYLPLVIGHAPILDVGCGRGEFLDLLASAHVPAIGVDSDAGMVARCHAKGLRVIHTNVLPYLRDAEPHSFGAIFAAQVIEHLSYDDLLDFLRLAHRALQPGGLLIAETINPHALPAFKTFWTDLTHHNPIFPEVLTVLCRLIGYHTAAVFFSNGSGEFDQDRRTQGEYAIIATTPGPNGELTNPLLTTVPPRIEYNAARPETTVGTPSIAHMGEERV